MIGGWEVPVLVIGALVLFGADKVPKLARSLGQAKKEFMVGQAEHDTPADPQTSAEKPPEIKQP